MQGPFSSINTHGGLARESGITEPALGVGIVLASMCKHQCDHVKPVTSTRINQQTDKPEMSVIPYDVS